MNRSHDWFLELFEASLCLRFQRGSDSYESSRSPLRSHSILLSVKLIIDAVKSEVLLSLSICLFQRFLLVRDQAPIESDKSNFNSKQIQ